MYIDVHCHLTGDEYQAVGGVEQVIARANALGVTRMICSGFDLQSSKRACILAEKHESVYFCAGFHPSELAKWQDGDLQRLETLCQHEKCVAVGEIGLDYHYENNPEKDEQKQRFIQQLQLANKLGLPVVLHSRDAAEDTLNLLRENKALLQNGALMHCYSYSAEMVEQFSSLGAYFSFGGPSTFKNAKKVQESVKRVHGSRILSETDCPYLTPEPLRGTFPNQPAHIPFVVKKLCELTQTDEETLKKQLMDNAKTLFKKLQ